MSTVVAFPAERCSRTSLVPVAGEGARIYILPVVRIERHGEPAVEPTPPRQPAPGNTRRLLR